MPKNWLPNEALKTKGWAQIKKEYDNTLNELIALLQDKDDAFLSKIYYDTDFKGDYPYSFLINGMLHHDVYHLGQLGMIIKLLNDKYRVRHAELVSASHKNYETLRPAQVYTFKYQKTAIGVGGLQWRSCIKICC